ncbi:MAG: endolytic transglycosylase MltG [Alphaproteobacteria bacterium]|jgi:UPF0755 protein|nr:endolytic transglycosylase MltG [Alphaproteobacteria bacterium]MDP6565270.1 endolytic transglycosylase MltG [Alphaproteobacteria bacterium]
MSRRILKFLALAVLLAVLGAIAAFGWGYAHFSRPGPAGNEKLVVLPRGSGVGAIAGRLQAAGVISEPAIFAAGARLGGWSRALKAGEFRIPARASMREIVAILVEGKTVVRRLTIPEGLTVTEILALLHDTEGLSGAVEGRPAEGALLPETYHFSYGDGREALLERMRDGMRKTLAELWPGREKDLPLATPAEAVILASMVEKETSLPEERPHIAGVFVNRLRRGMRLQSDPTAVYAITQGREPLGRALTRADLEMPSPYNTYHADGLPPGAIANPGRAAIAAVLHPLRTKDLYFVADGAGGHAFAASFAEHRHNVRRWRQSQRNKTSR